VIVPYARVPFLTPSSGSTFLQLTWLCHHELALGVSSRSGASTLSRTASLRSRYGNFVEACPRARPRLRNLGTRLEWIRITLVWARRRLSTSATQTRRASTPTERSILVREFKGPRSLRALACARDASRRPYTVPYGTVVVLALELPRAEARGGYPEGQRATRTLAKLSLRTGGVGREGPRQGLAD
jgi:hypothetical protein